MLLSKLYNFLIKQITVILIITVRLQYYKNKNLTCHWTVYDFWFKIQVIRNKQGNHLALTRSIKRKLHISFQYLASYSTGVSRLSPTSLSILREHAEALTKERMWLKKQNCSERRRSKTAHAYCVCKRKRREIAEFYKTLAIRTRARNFECCCWV